MANKITSITTDDGEVTVELASDFDYTDVAALSHVRSIIDQFQAFNGEAA